MREVPLIAVSEASSPMRSATVVSNRTAISAILSRRGLDLPLSQAPTARPVMPSLSAISACVRPLLALKSLNLVEKFMGIYLLIFLCYRKKISLSREKILRLKGKESTIVSTKGKEVRCKSLSQSEKHARSLF